MIDFMYEAIHITAYILAGMALYIIVLGVNDVINSVKDRIKISKNRAIYDPVDKKKGDV